MGVDPTLQPGGGRVGAQQLFSVLAASAEEAMVGLDPQETVTFWNRAAEDLFGYSAEEMLGHDAAALVPPERRDERRDLLARVRGGETVHSVATERRRKDGTRVVVSVTLAPVIGPDGNLLGMSAIGRDVTAQAEAAQRLARRERSALEARALLETLQACAPIGFGLVDTEFRVMWLNPMLGALSGLPAHQAIGRLGAEVVPAHWAQLEPLLRAVRDTGQTILNAEMVVEVPAEAGRARHWLTSFYPVPVDNEIAGVGIIALDITARKAAEQAHKALARATVGALASAIESRDPDTDGHQDRTALIARSIATDLGLDRDAVEGVDLAARIHDIGKIAVPTEILTNPKRLNVPAWELMKLHCATGANIVRGVEFSHPVAEVIEQHHERLDGSGYPTGIGGEEIVLGARIVAVADTVDAIVSHRPYRPAGNVDAALAEIERHRGRLFEPDVVDACLSLFREGRLGPPASTAQAARPAIVDVVTDTVDP